MSAPFPHQVLPMIIGILLILGVMLWAIVAWAETPIVRESWSTKQCIEVIDPSNQYSCENMPRKYEHQWVR